MIRNVTVNPAGMEFGLSLSKHNVEVFYKNREISDYMQYGVVPRQGESFDNLEKRLVKAEEELEELSQDTSYYKIPKDWQSRFRAYYGIEVGKRMLIKLPDKDIQGAMNLVSAAAVAYRENDIGIVTFKTMYYCTYGIFTHEAIHNVLYDNPFYRSQEKHMNWFGADVFPIPLLYSPLDKWMVFNEALAEDFSMNDGGSCPKPAIPGWFGKAAMIGSGLASIAGGGPISAGVFLYLLATYSVKVPRTFANVTKYKTHKKRTKRLRETFGVKNALKMMMVSGPKELKILSKIAKGF